ncbi:hypothetical protein Lalb_Chr16g0389321 [Lupinus albus]|uniref:Uncharacterized protein n=1 Tax=Lupinus albus TaxID=3870 RepID=A0A6A4PA85_LUPAL|nr:hypothetical protein Lalb_Chr16g0389321 [Lupinus albus]
MHIVEIGLALLTYASLPLSYWEYAFTTAVFLINGLPSSSLDQLSPHSLLFVFNLTILSLRSLGVLVFPY